jgi:hypothetical protein
MSSKAKELVEVYEAIPVSSGAGVKDFKVATASKKVPLDMLPLRALAGAARVFQFGGKKYAPGNFLNASPEDGFVARYAGGALRHLKECQSLDGTYDFKKLVGALDIESGLPEIDHMICGLIMLRAIAIKHGMAEDPGEGKAVTK